MPGLFFKYKSQNRENTAFFFGVLLKMTNGFNKMRNIHLQGKLEIQDGNIGKYRHGFLMGGGEANDSCRPILVRTRCPPARVLRVREGRGGEREGGGGERRGWEASRRALERCLRPGGARERYSPPTGGLSKTTKMHLHAESVAREAS